MNIFYRWGKSTFYILTIQKIIFTSKSLALILAIWMNLKFTDTCVCLAWNCKNAIYNNVLHNTDNRGLGTSSCYLRRQLRQLLWESLFLVYNNEAQRSAWWDRRRSLFVPVCTCQSQQWAVMYNSNAPSTLVYL